MQEKKKRVIGLSAEPGIFICNTHALQILLLHSASFWCPHMEKC